MSAALPGRHGLKRLHVVGRKTLRRTSEDTPREHALALACSARLIGDIVCLLSEVGERRFDRIKALFGGWLFAVRLEYPFDVVEGEPT